MTTPGPYEGEDEFNIIPGENGDIRAAEALKNSAWVPDDALAALVTERDLHAGETEEQMARRLMIENVGAAVMSIVNVAMHGSTERSRLDASKYIVERVLGRVGDDAFGGTRSPAELLVESVTDYVHSQDGVDG